MIQELLKKYKDKMCRESHSYRLRQIVYLELIEIFKGEEMTSGSFQRYFICSLEALLPPGIAVFMRQLI